MISATSNTTRYGYGYAATLRGIEEAARRVVDDWHLIFTHVALMSPRTVAVRVVAQGLTVAGITRGAAE